MNTLNTTSKVTAILSFGIGTVLFALQMFFKNADNLIPLGILFIAVAIAINIISLIVILFSMINHPNERLELLKTCGIILLNIPIAILYFYILFRHSF